MFEERGVIDIAKDFDEDIKEIFESEYSEIAESDLFIEGCGSLAELEYIDHYFDHPELYIDALGRHHELGGYF